MGIALVTSVPHTAMSFLPHSSELSDCENNQEIHEDGIPTPCPRGADEKEPLPVPGVTGSLFPPPVFQPPAQLTWTYSVAFTETLPPAPKLSQPSPAPAKCHSQGQL